MIDDENFAFTWLQKVEQHKDRKNSTRRGGNEHKQGIITSKMTPTSTSTDKDRGSWQGQPQSSKDALDFHSRPQKMRAKEK